MVLTQNLERILHDMVTENAELQQQLMRKEAELTRAEETIRREQQLVQAKDRELAEAQQQLRQQVSCACACMLYRCACMMHECTCVCVCIIQGETIRREEQLVRAKERELAQAQQQLRQQVS